MTIKNMTNTYSDLSQTLTAETAMFVPPAAYELVASMQSDVGCVRAGNEDNGQYASPSETQLRADKGALMIVCDGMGGHTSGEVASHLAVETIRREYYASAAEPSQAIKEATERANREVYQTAVADETLRGMGTTCTALALCRGMAFCAHVGDSRLYMLREEEIYQLTEDHSAVMELVKMGVITMDEARDHPDKNVILRALGTAPQLEVSVWNAPLPVRENDQFLLCSDGLYDLVADEEIKMVLRARRDDPQTACGELIALAKERGGHDNITVGIIGVRPCGDAPAPRITREVEIAR